MGGTTRSKTLETTWRLCAPTSSMTSASRPKCLWWPTKIYAQSMQIPPWSTKLHRAYVASRHIIPFVLLFSLDRLLYVCWLRWVTSTMEGSASVDVSPSLSASPSAILRKMRRMILPARRRKAYQINRINRKMCDFVRTVRLEKAARILHHRAGQQGSICSKKPRPNPCLCENMRTPLRLPKAANENMKQMVTAAVKANQSEASSPDYTQKGPAHLPPINKL